MSLRTASLITQSALRANQTALGVTAANIANADTAGYTAKSATQAAVSAGQGSAGSAVDVTGISRDVDQFVTRQIVAASSSAGAAGTLSDYLAKIETVYGSVSTGGGDSIAGVINEVTASLESLASGGSADEDKAATVTALVDMAASLTDASASLQGYRAQADQQIADTVAQANAAIQSIADLNDSIVQAAAAGRPTADLEDQREVQLKSLAGLIDVNYSVDSSGRMQVYTTGGSALVTANAHTLGFTAAASMDADTVYSATPPSDLSGITLNGQDISRSISSGSLRSLLDLRDDILVDEQTRLDSLASTIIDQVNAVHNSGTSYPPADSLTGTRAVTGGDTLAGSGSFTLVATSGDTVAASLSIDLATVSTVQDLVDAINADGHFSAGITAGGKLSIASATNGQGIAIDQGSSAAGGEGVSAYFGLNDLLTGSDASDIAVRRDIVDDPARLATATLAGTTAGQRAVSSGDVGTATALADLFSGTSSFASAGGLGARSTSFSGYAGDIISAASRSASTASSRADTASSSLSDLTSAFASQSGVSLDEETAATQALETAYQAAARVMAALQSMYDELIEMVS
ncbi:flagellar hook-associated protein FlgK [Oleisolibacter albus]|uniref:flagellar hook-associated protein FlgK n=1 Tax=Oleisolibacter albus TaxID=2171757 RepID=UPI000DF47675|nr:flagellar hook-associated protein FlgK [Oleisolibacter albus]